MAKRATHFKRTRLPMSQRVFVVALAALLAAAVGGTLAYLVAQTTPVVNTFTYGDVDLTLEEKDDDGTHGDDGNFYEMLPGKTIIKKPKVTVEANSVKSYVFVKLVPSDNFKDFLTYQMADGWTALNSTDYPGVYFRIVDTSDQDQEFSVLKNDTVTVRSDVTKEQLNALDAGPGDPTYPTLTVTAYAVQEEGMKSAWSAWKTIQDAQTTTSDAMGD